MYVVSYDTIVVKVSNSGLPISIKNALYIPEIDLTLEVYHIQSDIITCIAIGNTSKITFGMEVKFMSETIKIKYSKSIIGKIIDPMFNILMGNKEKNEEEIEIKLKKVNQEIENVDGKITTSETGIKVIDMFCPYIIGGKVGILGGAGAGKEQPIDSLIKIENGWKKMGDINIGDFICDVNGSLSKVEGVFPQGEKYVYKVIFEDKREVECGQDHLWKVNILNLKKNNLNNFDNFEIIKTIDIEKQLLDNSDNKCYFIPLIKPVISKSKILKINPYIYGLIISSYSYKSKNKILTKQSQVYNYLLEELNKLGLSFETEENDKVIFKNKIINNKIINKQDYLNQNFEYINSIVKEDKIIIDQDYLNASTEQKIDFLRGIFDTFGYININGIYEYSTNSKDLALFIREIIWSLGGVCYLHVINISTLSSSNEKVNNKIIYKIKIKINSDIKLFLFNKKILSIIDSNNNKINKKCKIIKIEKLETKKQMQCIKVSAEDSLYITDNYIATHNTTVIMELIRNMREKDVFTIFAGIGERMREGHSFYNELIDVNLIDKKNPKNSNIIIVFGNMDQHPSIRSRSAITSIAIAEYIRDVENKNVLFLMDNIFRYSQAENEISSALGLMASDMGYQPSLFYDMSVLQERIYSNNNGNSITSIQAIYVPADDMQDPAVISIMKHIDTSIILKRNLAYKGIYPAIDPLESNSIAMNEKIIGKKHYEIYCELKRILSRDKELENIVNIVGRDNLSDEDKLCFHRARLIYSFITQPFKVGEIYTGIKGEFVSLEKTIEGFENIIKGNLDNISENELLFIGEMK